jgi:DNA polymerase-1
MFCETYEQALALIETCDNSGTFAFDVETSGLSPHVDTLLGLGLACPEAEGYIPLEVTAGVHDVNMRTALSSLFTRPGAVAIAHRAYFDVSFIRSRGVEVSCELHDPKAMAFLLDENQRTGLKPLAETKLGLTPYDMPVTTCPCCGKSRIVHEDMYDVGYYCAYDCLMTLNLYNLLLDEVAAKYGVPYDVARNVARVVGDVNQSSLDIDREKLGLLYDYYRLKRAMAEQYVYDFVGQRFNIKATKELAHILFEVLGYPVVGTSKKTGAPSTDVWALKKLKAWNEGTVEGGGEFITALLTFRKADKLVSTYLEPFTFFDKLAPSFDCYGAKTGRFSCRKPNLQNQPEKIRNVIVARPGKKLVAADYSQLELRLLAHFTQEPEMVDGYNRGDFDLHDEVATDIDVSRRAAKAINFGIAYGKTEYGLAADLILPLPHEVKVPIARNYLKKYKERFPKVAAWCEEQGNHIVYRDAKNQKLWHNGRGYVETILGRKRRIPDGKNLPWRDKKHARNQAVNAPIQGSAADVINMALTDVGREYMDELRLQVHDELVLEADEGIAEEVGKHTAALMVGVGEQLGLTVPLEVDVRIVDSWAKKPISEGRLRKMTEELQSVSDVIPSTGGNPDAKQVKINDVLDMEVIIKEFRGPVPGAYGECFFVEVDTKEGETMSFPTSGMVLVEKLGKLRDDKLFPIKGTFFKQAGKTNDYYDVK